MKSVNIRQLRALLSRVDQVLAEEGELLVTSRGKAVARMLPAGRARGAPSHAELRSRMRPLETGSESLIRRDRESR